MEIFIKAENYQVWRVIEIGDFKVTKKNDKGELILKPLKNLIKKISTKWRLTIWLKS